MSITIAAVSVGIFTACLAPLGCAPTTPPAVVTIDHNYHGVTDVAPPQRLDVTGGEAWECPNLGGDWNDDTLTCEGVDY